MKTYTVEYERDLDGRWVAAVRGVAECHTQGRTIRQARERIREALTLFVGETAAAQATLRDAVKLPKKTQDILARQRAARARADTEARRATEQTARAVRELTRQGLSTRDAGELLKLSGQRVSQVRRVTR